MRNLTNVYKSKKLIKISLSYDEKNNSICSIKISGDFFLYPEEKLEALEANLIGVKLEKESIREKVKETLIDSKPFGFDVDSMTEAIAGCLRKEGQALRFNKIRFLETGYNSGPLNMAVDEVLMMGASETPVFRIYGWNPSCVSIGYFQSVEDVNLKKCEKEGVDVVRRITGGGAVFHDKELTYSFITKKYPQGILDSYKIICSVITSSLNRLGLNAKFSPLNDITVNSKKVCGNAQTRKKNTLLQHGTILLTVDAQKMFSLLKVPKEKIENKGISDATQRVAGVNKKFEDIAHSIKKSLTEVFGAELVFDQLSKDELELSNNLAHEKYSSKKWNFRR